MTSDLGDVVKWPTLGRPVERRQNRSSKFDLGNGGSPSPFANYSFSTFLSFLSTIFPLLRLVFSIFDVIYVHWDRIRRSSSSSGGGGGLVALKKPGKFFFFFLLPDDDDDVDDTKLIFGGAAAESRKTRRKVWRRKVVWTRRRRTLFRWCNVTLVIVPNVFNSIHSKMIRFKRCSLHFCFVRSGQSEAFVSNGGKKDSIVPHTKKNVFRLAGFNSGKCPSATNGTKDSTQLKPQSFSFFQQNLPLFSPSLFLILSRSLSSPHFSSDGGIKSDFVRECLCIVCLTR